MPKPEEPSGYAEIGETLASAVVFAGQTKEWALEYATLFGYRRADLNAWIKHFKLKKRAQVKRFERETSILSNKGRSAQELRLKVIDSLNQSQLELARKRDLGSRKLSADSGQ